MKVKDLINRLSNVPLDTEVIFITGNYAGFDYKTLDLDRVTLYNAANEVHILLFDTEVANSD